MCGAATWALSASGLSQELENDQTVRPVVRLKCANGRGVDVTGIFDASLFGMHIGNVSAKGF